MTLNSLLYFLPFFILATLASSSTFISDDVFDSHGAAGRSLLQVKKDCSLDFENMNYTVITSRCKGPRYAANLCCGAFKDFACPSAEQLNDMTNDCATTMFSYINLYGKYPPGLFANECRGDKNGLECPEGSETSKVSVNQSSDGQMTSSYSLMPMLGSGALVFLYHFF